jgi:predicted metal-dependent enzyme (double-stranded beta helix superfamily)
VGSVTTIGVNRIVPDGQEATASVGDIQPVAGAIVQVTGVGASASVGFINVYGEIDTNQTPNYTVVDDSQTPSYSEISTSQTPGYSEIDAGRSAA